MDHGVIATASREPLMNANDHVPMVNIMPFGFCKKGMPCMPVTPLAWVDVNKKHIIDGAPALTEDSKLACYHGGVISIVPLDAGSAEEGDRNDNGDDVVEEIKAAALGLLGSIVAKRIPFVKNLVKMSGKKKSAKGGGNKGKGSGGGGESKKARSSNTGSVDNILEGATETTNGKGVARNFEKSGGFEQTLKDFESLDLDPTSIKEIQTQYGLGKVGKLKDGTTVVARPGSNTGGSTLEIRVSNTKVFKVRY